MPGAKKYSTLPENADKVLFAEDFVNHILRKLDFPPLSSGIADHRGSVFNAFSQEVIKAAEIAYEAEEEDTEQEFKKILEENGNTIDRNVFLEYFTPMESEMLRPAGEEGFRDFIFICVRISLMAGRFHKHGHEEAPGLAVDYITSLVKDIDMMKEKVWEALDTALRDWSHSFSDSGSQHDSHSRSPDPVMDGGKGQDEHPEELTDDKMCTAAISSSSKEPVSLSSHESEPVEKMYDAKAGISIAKSDSVSPDGSSKGKNSDSSIHSFTSTSSEDDISKQKRPSCSHSKDSADSDSKRCKTAE